MGELRGEMDGGEKEMIKCNVVVGSFSEGGFVDGFFGVLRVNN